MTSANSRRFCLNVCASASAAALRFASLAILQQIEGRLDAERLALDLEAQAHDGFVEQPVPGGRAADRLLMEQLLDAVLELIRLLLADVLDPRPVVAEHGIGHRGLEPGVVDAIELELEEQEMQGRRVMRSCTSP